MVESFFYTVSVLSKLRLSETDFCCVFKFYHSDLTQSSILSVIFHLPLLKSVRIELNWKNHFLKKLEGDRKRVCEKMLKSSDSALVMNEPGTGQGNDAQRSRLSCAGRARDFIGCWATAH